MLDEIVTEVLARLQAEENLKDVRFVPAFSPARKPAPLRRPMGTVGLRGVTMEEGALGGLLGRREGNSLTGGRAAAELSIGLYLPRESGGAACGELFSRLCDCLALGGLQGVRALTAGPAHWEEDAGAYVMECTLRLRLYLGREESGQPVTGLVVKGVGV